MSPSGVAKALGITQAGALSRRFTFSPPKRNQDSTTFAPLAM
jgi:hypothetical protein